LKIQAPDGHMETSVLKFEYSLSSDSVAAGAESQTTIKYASIEKDLRRGARCSTVPVMKQVLLGRERPARSQLLCHRSLGLLIVTGRVRGDTSPRTQRQRDASKRYGLHGVPLFADQRLAEVKRAQDPRVWEANHTRLQEESATSATAFEQAKALRADAGALVSLQQQITTLSQAAAEARPPRVPQGSALALESEIGAALAVTPEGSARDGHDRMGVEKLGIPRSFVART